MRAEGWEDRLQAAIEASRGKPFKWGDHDCALFAATVVEQVVGVDFAAQWRGYDTELGALRRVREAGGLAALVTSVLGDPVLPALARRGDVVLLQRDLEPPWDGALGICVGHQAVFTSPSGLAFAPMPAWALAWRVG